MGCCAGGANGPLRAAVLNGDHVAAAQLLSSDPAAARAPLRSGNTILHLAAELGSIELLQVALSAVLPEDARAYLDMPNPRGSTALMLACKYGREDALIWLLGKVRTQAS